MGSTCGTLSHRRAIVLAEYYESTTKSKIRNITEIILSRKIGEMSMEVRTDALYIETWISERLPSMYLKPWWLTC
jgi:hypothetical protein